jgi:hypothetical protein
VEKCQQHAASDGGSRARSRISPAFSTAAGVGIAILPVLMLIPVIVSAVHLNRALPESCTECRSPLHTLSLDAKTGAPR